MLRPCLSILRRASFPTYRPRTCARLGIGSIGEALIGERWLLGRLRRRTFTSLADVDAALGELMAQLNDEQNLRRLGVTRRQLLEEVDRPALKALPGEPYEYCEWRARRVGIDYHVDIDAHYYSVPCTLRVSGK